MDKTYNAQKLTVELAAAGLTMQGCDDTGRIFWPIDPNPGELVTAQAVLEAHNPDPDPDPLQDYTQAGITPNQMLLALWDLTVNGKNDSAAAFQTRIGQQKGA